MREGCIITNHRPLVAILSKDKVMLSKWLQYFMLRICHLRVCIIYKPGLDLYIVDWLSWNNHNKNKDQEIAGISINVSAISPSVNMQVCMCIEDIDTATWEDTHQQELKVYIIQDWPHKKEEVEHSMIQYWPVGIK